GDDDHADRVVVAQGGEGGAQLGQHGIAEGIAALGTIERDGGDEAVAGERDVVRHGGTCITLRLDRHARGDYHPGPHDSLGHASYREGAAGIPHGMPSASGGARPATEVTDSTDVPTHEARDRHRGSRASW